MPIARSNLTYHWAEPLASMEPNEQTATSRQEHPPEILPWGKKVIMHSLNYCSQQQLLVPRIAAQRRSAPGITWWAGAAAPSAPHATIGVPRTVSIITKTRSPKSLVPWQCPMTQRQHGLQITQPLWRRAPQHCQRDETADLRQLCHWSQRQPLFMGQGTEPPDSSASVPSCNAPRTTHPSAATTRGDLGERDLFSSSGKAARNVNSLICLDNMKNFSSIVYLKPQTNVMALSLPGPFDARRQVWVRTNNIYFQCQWNSKKQLHILTPNNRCGKKKRCD